MTSNQSVDVIVRTIDSPEREYHLTDQHPDQPGVLVAVPASERHFDPRRIMTAPAAVAGTPWIHPSALTVVLSVDGKDQHILSPDEAVALRSLVAAGARFARIESVSPDDVAALVGIGFNAFDGAPYDVATHDSFGDRLPEAE